MPTNDIYMLTVSGVVTGTLHMHTLHFRTNDPTADEADLYEAWTGAPMTAYRALFVPGAAPCSMIRIAKVCGSTPLPSPMEYPQLPPNSQGTKFVGASEPQASFLACAVTEKGSKAGRRYSGRFFIGGIYESETSGNAFYPDYLALVTAYCSALGATFVAPSVPAFNLFVYSRLLGLGSTTHVPPVPAVTQCQNAGSDVRQLVVNPQPTTMRSRKLGHGV